MPSSCQPNQRRILAGSRTCAHTVSGSAAMSTDTISRRPGSSAMSRLLCETDTSTVTLGAPARTPLPVGRDRARPDAATWRAWLLEHHASSPGVWLVLHKKGGATTALTYELAVQEALCFGWIDGQARSRDAESSLQRMTPRRPRSAWSVRNVERVARLELTGRMHDAGRAQVRAAQEDGRWQRPYAGQADAVVPEDLAAALSADPAAQAWFEVLTAANRFAVLYRVQARSGPRRGRVGSASSWPGWPVVRRRTPRSADPRRGSASARGCW